MRSASNTSSTSRFGVVSSTGRPASDFGGDPACIARQPRREELGAAGDQRIHVLADAAGPDPVRELERLGAEDRHTVAGDEHVDLVT